MQADAWNGRIPRPTNSQSHCVNIPSQRGDDSITTVIPSPRLLFEPFVMIASELFDTFEMGQELLESSHAYCTCTKVELDDI